MATWWAELYDDLLAEVLLERPESAATERTVDFLVAWLGLAPGDRVFDQCCGIGSLAVPLAARGYEVYGVDQAGGYVATARARVGDASAHFEVGDAFEYVPPAPVQGAFNWWTSFGYAPDDGTNQRMLQRAFEALVPGGRFALDYMNVPGVLTRFAPRVELERETSRGPVTLVRHSELDLLAGVMNKRWVYTLPDGDTVEHHSAVRLYAPDRVAALLMQAGFRQIEAVGDVDGQPLGLDSPRAIFVAQRPA